MPRSCPTVGSSASSTGGPWCNAAATARRRCSPPESSRGSAASRCPRPRAASRARARSVDAGSSPAAGPVRPGPAAAPTLRAVTSTSSSTVRATIVELDHCGTQARVAASSGADSTPGDTASDGPRATRTAAGSWVGRNPARACSAVDLPDPLGPTSAVSVPGAASRGSTSSAARRVRAVPSTSRVVRSTTKGAAVRDAVRPAGRGATRAGSTSIGSGGPAPGTQMPIARSRSRSLDRVACTGPSATTRPSAESTTSRSTRSTHGPSTCSTTTSVGAGVDERWAAALSERCEPADGHPSPEVSAATASRTSCAEAASSIAVGSSSSTTDGSRASVPARASRWVCPPDSADVGVSGGRSSRPTARSADATTPAMSPRGIRTFSGPNATSRSTDAATTPAPGSCSTSPTAPGRVPGATPSTVTAPVSSPASTVSSRPARARSSVDFPEPDGPTSSTRSPGRRVSETSRSTGSRRPKGRQVSPSTSTSPRTGRVPPSRRQTACCSRCSWPAGNADSAPARARARTSSQPTSPASTAPETAIAPR